MNQIYLDVTYEEAKKLGPSLFEQLSKETKFIVIRQMPEILALRSLILKRLSQAHRVEIEALWKEQRTPSIEAMGSMISTFRFIRDARIIPSLFSGFWAGAGLPMPLLVDSGHFRVVVPEESRLTYVKSPCFEASDFEIPWPFDSKENFFMKGSAAPHRDIDRPFYCYQINTWFPLNDLDSNETLPFFPEVRTDFEERLKSILGTDTFENYETYAPKLEFTPNLENFGFGKPTQVPVKVGDIFIFDCQDPHSSPYQKPGHVRINGELRLCTRCYDDNATFRRTFWSFNNFLPKGEQGTGNSVERAEYLAKSSDALQSGSRQHLADQSPLACSQTYFNALFASLSDACNASFVRGPVTQHPDLSDQDILNLVEMIGTFPFTDDRQVNLARYLAHNNFLKESRELVAEGVDKTQSFFWALEFAFVAIQNCWLPLAKDALLKTKELAQTTKLDLLPFSKLGIPKGPVANLSPETAALGASQLLESLGTLLQDKKKGVEFAARRDPRLFQFVSTIQSNLRGFTLYKVGSYYCAILNSQPYSTQAILNGSCGPCFFAESREELTLRIPKARFTDISRRTLSRGRSYLGRVLRKGKSVLERISS